jgi:hypothetical protein
MKVKGNDLFDGRLPFPVLEAKSLYTCCSLAMGDSNSQEILYSRHRGLF